jgi:hypothetical protein
MKIQIKHRFTGSVIFETDAETIGAAVQAAIVAKINLRSADLSYANLSYANLSSANLRSANLRSANLRSANLRSADLRSADLSSADLRELKTTKKELAAMVSRRTILADGDLIGWKKLVGGTICKLKIPAKADRVGGLIGRKCRCEFAEVIEGEGIAWHDRKTVYKPGETVKPDKYDPNPLVECSNGIHFFVTRLEAEEYEL